VKAVNVNDEENKWPEATCVFSCKVCYNNGCIIQFIMWVWIINDVSSN